jgi:hypothetical protein
MGTVMKASANGGIVMAIGKPRGRRFPDGASVVNLASKRRTG